MVLRKPLVTLALAGGAFGLSMGIGYAVASAATSGSTTASSSSATVSSSSATSTTTPSHPCPNMGSAPGASGSSGGTATG
jgi:hypothetical protein